MKRSIRLMLLAAVLGAALALSACGAAQTAEEPAPAEETATVTFDSPVDYSDPANWAYYESEKSDVIADVFFICPTVYGGSEEAPNMELDNEEAKAAFLAATNMEKGIYDENARFFAPYYQQAGMLAYTIPEDEGEELLAYGYEDVKAAFAYYLENENDGRPIIIAGFSQGGDLSIRLVRDFMADEELADRMVACYAIGWRLTEDEVTQYPQLVPAVSDMDTGCIVTFNSEKEGLTGSVLIPEGTWTYSINPLNWCTDGTPADRSDNIGACFPDGTGAITQEIPQLTGAYIEPERGALVVTDVTPEEFPPILSFFDDGVYHIYDYQFFYRNLQSNVATRLSAWCRGH